LQDRTKDIGMKSVLLHINEDAGQESRLAAATDIVRRNNGHLICLQATPLDAYLLVGDPFGAAYVPSGIAQTLREREKMERARIELSLQDQGIDWEWRHAEGSAAQVLTEHAKLADLVVLSLPEHEETMLPRRAPLAADVAVHVQSPVLAVPVSGTPRDYGGPAIIAWNGSSEAAHAVRLSLALLRAASSVHVVGIKENEKLASSTDVCGYLAEHGIKTETHQWPREDASVADALMAAAAKLDAEYIVLGAYGHSRMRETVLGGVTQDLIFASSVPLLLAH
jgi:nucleotide-binding universal stress UspA family protein